MQQGSLLEVDTIGPGDHGALLGPAAGPIPSREPLIFAPLDDPSLSGSAWASFTAAAASLAALRPWRELTDDHWFEVSSVPLAMARWVGSVLGHDGSSPGLVVDRSLAERRQRLLGTPDKTTTPLWSLRFLPHQDLPQPWQQALTDHDWPVFDQAGWPCLAVPEGAALPAAADRWVLETLEGVCRALEWFIASTPELAQRWHDPTLPRRRRRVPVGADQEVMQMAIAAMGSNDLQEKKATIPPVTALPPRSQQERIPADLRAKVDSLMEMIEDFCGRYLNGEYRDLCYKATARLARKRPSPLSAGREPSWAAGIIHAIGITNFLFDPSQTPHCKAPQIYDHFRISSQTGQAHSKKVRDLLKIHPFDHHWTLPSRLADSPISWMVEVNGFILDARNLPLELQIVAWQKGLIPYVPILKKQGDPDQG